MICPIITEQITEKHDNIDQVFDEGQHVFLIASSIHFFGVICYAIFARESLRIGQLLLHQKRKWR